MREALKSARRFTSAPSWDDFIVNEYGSFALAVTDEQLEQYARSNAHTMDHVCCTASMGKTGSKGPGSGVLNSDLTVKGTVGLRVVDASAFVSQRSLSWGRGSITLTYITTLYSHSSLQLTHKPLLMF